MIVCTHSVSSTGTLLLAFSLLYWISLQYSCNLITQTADRFPVKQTKKTSDFCLDKRDSVVVKVVEVGFQAHVYAQSTCSMTPFQLLNDMHLNSLLVAL